MPSHKVHRAIEKLILKKSHDDVHRIMDAPARILGKKHRLFLHDPISCFLLFNDNPEKINAALLHVLVDELSKDRATKILMEMLTYF